MQKNIQTVLQKIEEVWWAKVLVAILLAIPLLIFWPFTIGGALAYLAFRFIATQKLRWALITLISIPTLFIGSVWVSAIFEPSSQEPESTEPDGQVQTQSQPEQQEETQPSQTLPQSQSEQQGEPQPKQQEEKQESQHPSVIEPEPIKLSGVGQKASKKFTLESGLSVFEMTHGGTSNFAITLLDSNGEWVELLVNGIGSFDGSKAVGITNKGSYILDITADGKWSVTIKQPRPSVAPSKTKFTGKGQQASALFSIKGGLKVFKMTHNGSSNFAVLLLDRNGQWVELLVNEIGRFDGSKAVRIPSDGIYILDITADGSWAVTIE